MRVDKIMVQELRQHELFHALSEVQFQQLLETATVRSLAADEPLFVQGDTASEFFLLRQGCVKLYRLSTEGDEKIMRLIRPPQSFAESILFMDPARYPVSATAVETARLLAFDRATFLAILHESFATCFTLMAQMTQRIQEHWDEIEMLALQNSRYRVVHYLLGLIPGEARSSVTVLLPTRKTVIAAHLAVTPETLSRTLRSLSEEELIEVAGDRVTVRDVGKLRRCVI